MSNILIKLGDVVAMETVAQWLWKLTTLWNLSLFLIYENLSNYEISKNKTYF